MQGEDTYVLTVSDKEAEVIKHLYQQWRKLLLA